jgi:hypothetical protein
MVETLRNTQKTLLPFISSQQAGDSIAKDETEKATVFCLTELGRQKGGGLFKKREPEKIVFVSETYYPFWVVPFRNLTLLFDGLDLASHTIRYLSVPDAKTFMDNLSQRASSRQVYATFLSNHLNYFQGSVGEQTEVLEGLIFDADFLSEFIEYAKEAITSDTVVDGVLVSPAQDEAQIEEKLRDLEGLHLRLERELEELNGIIKVLNKQAQHALVALRKEIKATEDKFGVQIEKAKAVLEQKRSSVNRRYSDKVTEISDRSEQELIGLHKEIIALRKTNEQISSEIANVENEIKTAMINKDEGAEQKWKEKRDELKKQLPETMTATKNLEAKVQEIEGTKKNVLFQLKQENDAALKEAGKELIDIESSRDAEIKNCKDKMEQIEDFTSTIIGKIDQLTKIREAEIVEFENLGIRQERTSKLLVYMPFYLICYQSRPNKRCTYLAPSIASDRGTSGLRALGKKKITKLFQPRSQKITSILNGFLKLLEENVAFSHEINEACSKANLLGSKNKVELVRAGLSRLRTEGWLSDSEFESFSQMLP